MRKRNAEILRLEVALQDFAKLAIVIHDEQMRLDVLNGPTGNFPHMDCGCTHVCNDSDLNRNGAVRTKP
jgi:hypothetical protein